MHSDQHALGFSNWSGKALEVYVGNDGGAYAGPIAQKTPASGSHDPSGA
jgi:hypothetical protein